MKWFVGMVVLLQILVVSAQAQVPVTSTTTLLVDRNEPPAIQKAASDLASDMDKVFGTRVQVVHRPANAHAVTVWIGLKGQLPKAVERPSGWEVLALQVVRNPLPGSPIHEAIVLTGSDVLGTVYAIYQFSQQFLGVDPLYWWTDHEPARKAEVLVPRALNEVQGPPRFRYRGWFINDEDLLTGWKPGYADGTGISLKVWNRIFEAILRLKGNMIVPGTFIFPYEPQVIAAGQRGLFIAQHHVEPLGLNTYRWPSGQPYSFVSHPNLLSAAWGRAVGQYRNSKIIWTVGYRGENDRPFWVDDKRAPKTDKARAAVIRDAIEKQMGIVRAAHHNPVFIMNAWQESSRFVREGVLHIPEGVTLVWPDNGHGLIQDGNMISKGQGVYYHTAMYDGRSNHFTERVPLDRIAHELGRAAQAGATTYLLINTSNTRPVVMTTRAAMQLAWDAKSWVADGTRESSVYLQDWCREEFGPAGSILEEYYRRYFKAPAVYGDKADDRMADNFYQTAARRLLLALVLDNDITPVQIRGVRQFSNLANEATFLAKICKQADSRWAAAKLVAEKAKPLVPADRRKFFQANVLTQVGVQLHSNRMLENVAQLATGLSSAQQLVKLNSALQEEEKVEEALRAADYGKWKGFYTRGDWLVDIPLTIELMRAYHGKLEGKPIPENVVVRARDGAFSYTMIKAYQGGQRDQF